MKSRKTASRRSPKNAKPKSTGSYLATLDKDKRSALQKLRKAIKAAAPQAEECISYGLPAFRLHGKFLVAYGAAANHCAFYPGSVTQMAKQDLRGYDTSKGTIRFPPNKPLPSTLIRKLVKFRMAKQAAPR